VGHQDKKKVILSIWEKGRERERVRSELLLTGLKTTRGYSFAFILTIFVKLMKSIQQ
jgi:hypothetical protein